MLNQPNSRPPRQVVNQVEYAPKQADRMTVAKSDIRRRALDLEFEKECIEINDNLVG